MGHESTTRFSPIICWEICPKKKKEREKVLVWENE